MSRMSVAEAALAWGVSQRLVQRWCAEGAIPGVEKFGRSWSIPAGSRAPGSAAGDAPVPAADEGAMPSLPRGTGFAVGCMPLMNTAFAPGHALEAVLRVSSPGAREIALAEYSYFCGRPEEAARMSEGLLESDDAPLRLSACLIYAFANLPLDRSERSLAALGAMDHTVSALGEGGDPSLAALTRCVHVAANVLLHIPLAEGEDLSMSQVMRDVRQLPQGLRLFALYVSAHAAYLSGDYGRCAGVAEAALVATESVYPIPAVYLHLAAAMGHMGLRRADMARQHVLDAWSLARPDGLVEPMAEHHGLLGGMLETVIKPDWPDDFRRIIDITYRFSAGWRSVHNPVTGETVADNLTTTEFVTAMLASHGWQNQDIAEHLGVAVSTVKSLLSSAFQKLGISQRDDLNRFMLR